MKKRIVDTLRRAAADFRRNVLEDEVEGDPSGESNIAPVSENIVPPAVGSDASMDDEFEAAVDGGAAPQQESSPALVGLLPRR